MKVFKNITTYRNFKMCLLYSAVLYVSSVLTMIEPKQQLAHKIRPSLQAQGLADMAKKLEGEPISKLAISKDLEAKLTAINTLVQYMKLGPKKEALALAGRSKEIVADPTLIEAAIALADKEYKDDVIEALIVGAIRYGNIDTLQYFINHGIDVNQARDLWGTPLHTAAQYGQPEVVKFLLEHGADIHALESRGMTALTIARTAAARLPASHKKSNYLDTIKLLQEHAAKLQPKEQRLRAEAAVGNNEAIDRLVKEGINVNAPDENGDTALILAIKNRRIDTVRHLLMSGASKAIKTSGGLTPYELALELGYDDIAQLLNPSTT